MFDVSASDVLREAAAYYAASFVSRAKFLELEYVRMCRKARNENVCMSVSIKTGAESNYCPPVARLVHYVNTQPRLQLPRCS